MIYRICGGISLLLLGLSMAGFTAIAGPIIGILLIVAGCALLAGV